MTALMAERPARTRKTRPPTPAPPKRSVRAVRGVDTPHPLPRDAKEWVALLRMIPDYDPFAQAGSRYVFDEERAVRAIEFFHKCLRFIEGSRAGKPFFLEPWQMAVLANAFGWVDRDTGFRRYTEVYQEIPRKNGKTPLAAGVALLTLFDDGEAGAQVYLCAGSQDQAKLAYRHARFMTERSPSLKRLASINRAYSSITIDSIASSLRAIPADGDLSQGFNVSASIDDELHVWRGRDLYDAMTKGMASRDQPLAWHITTAGWDRTSICWSVRQRAVRVRSGELDDPTMFPVIYAAPDDADIADERVWKIANPNLGVSVREDFLRAEAKKAKDDAAAENAFKRYHLDIWTEQDVRWIPMERWDQCAWEGNVAIGRDDRRAQRAWRADRLERLRGRPCYAGLDASSRVDLTSLALVFPPEGDETRSTVLQFSWVPAANMAQREVEDRALYRQWEQDGFLEPTPGDVIDYEALRRRILWARDTFDLRELAFDPRGVEQLVLELGEDEGVECVEFRQGRPMSEPARNLHAAVLAGRLDHGGDPVMRWSASGVVVKVDDDGNIRLNKAKSTSRIDPIVALAMALARADRGGGGGAYTAERGLIVL